MYIYIYILIVVLYLFYKLVGYYVTSCIEIILFRLAISFSQRIELICKE